MYRKEKPHMGKNCNKPTGEIMVLFQDKHLFDTYTKSPFDVEILAYLILHVHVFYSLI